MAKKDTGKNPQAGSRYPGTRLPRQFVGKAPNPLKAQRRATAFNSLPFIAGPRTRGRALHWHVPSTGGYFGGYETGEAMALAFLKFLRASEDKSPPIYWLTTVLSSLIARYEQEGGHAMDRRAVKEQSEGFSSVRGQLSGFSNTLSLWLTAAAKQLGHRLDGISDKELLDRANAGLGFDNAAYWNSMANDDGEG